LRHAALLALAVLLGAGAAWGDGVPASDAPPPGESAPAAEKAWSDEDDWLFEEGPDPAERDDLEGSNRAVFGFNEAFYRYLADPVTRGFEWLVPEPGRRALHRFFDNLDQPAHFVNCVLQLAPLDATKTLSRFTLNTTIGVLGLFDPATPLGMPAVQTDFGETLAVYGTPAGSYVVIPILGPSTARDTFGEIVDAFLHPAVWFASPAQQVVLRSSGGISAYDVEKERLDALRATSVDFYAAIRGAYLLDRDARVEARVAGRWWREDEEPDTAVAAPAQKKDGTGSVPAGPGGS
jgi:phospholipid-binding lipoprotein MlaA